MFPRIEKEPTQSCSPAVRAENRFGRPVQLQTRRWRESRDKKHQDRRGKKASSPALLAIRRPAPLPRSNLAPGTWQVIPSTRHTTVRHLNVGALSTGARREGHQTLRSIRGLGGHGFLRGLRKVQPPLHPVPEPRLSVCVSSSHRNHNAVLQQSLSSVRAVCSFVAAVHSGLGLAGVPDPYFLFSFSIETATSSDLAQHSQTR